MADPSRFTADELARQARQHLESLRQAGVDWLPTAPLPAREPPVPVDEVTPAVPAASLFPDEAPLPPPNAAVPPEQRRQALQVLAETVSHCTRCSSLASTRTQTVFGVGPIDVELCFIGEAPGADEDAQGEPFVGAAGQLLNRIIAACGLKREEVYICNIIKCVHGFTNVLTQDGWQQIQRIVARRYSGLVAAVDEAGLPRWARITGYYRSPLAGRRLVKLHYSSSRRSLKVTGGVFTEDHEVLTNQGYKKIQDLDPVRDRIHTGTLQPSAEIRQALVGMLLGDARFHPASNTFACGHSQRQRDYIHHKAKILGIPSGAVQSYCLHNRKNGQTYFAERFHAKATPYFRSLCQLFYPGKRKSVSAAGLREFSLISLAYLFMDDGYLRLRANRSPAAEIATCCFPRDEVDLLRAKISDLGIESYTHPNSRYPRIHFDVENTALLSRSIAPYVHESLNYKLIPEHRTIEKAVLHHSPEPFYDTFEVMPAIDSYARHCRTVYCLGVEHFENFITRSGVMHNCRPPGNRTPQADEAANCREYLEKQLELVRPKFICALGGTAAKNLLGTEKSLGQLRRQFHSYRGIPVLCTYHPAFLLPHRSPEKKRDVWEDMKMLLARMGRPIPGKSTPGSS